MNEEELTQGERYWENKGVTDEGMHDSLQRLVDGRILEVEQARAVWIEWERLGKNAEEEVLGVLEEKSHPRCYECGRKMVGRRRDWFCDHGNNGRRPKLIDRR